MGSIRYTCAKKNHTVLREDCKGCVEYNPCAKDGKWCFVGALLSEHDPNIASAGQDALQCVAAPVLRDTSTVTINLGDGMSVDVSKEELRNSIKKQIYKGMSLKYGA